MWHVLCLQQDSDYDQLLAAYNASQQSLQQSSSTISVSSVFTENTGFVIFYVSFNFIFAVLLHIYIVQWSSVCLVWNQNQNHAY